MTSDPLDPGLREELLTTALQARLNAIDAKRVERRALDVAEARAFVIRQAEALVAEWLRTTSDPDPATLTNQLARNLGAELLARYELLTPAELLTGILPVSDGLAVPVLPDRPQLPLTANELLVNDRKQPSIGSQLKAEPRPARSSSVCAPRLTPTGTMMSLRSTSPTATPSDVSHVGNRPMQVTWELEHPLPDALLETSQLVAAA